jgi:hypothetical protein
VHSTTKTLLSSAILGAALTAPFVLLQLVNRAQFNEEFPFVLFFVIWLNLFALSAILAPVVRALHEGRNLFTSPIRLGIIILFSFLFASGISGLIADQWPCFMGVQYCD